MNIQEPPWKDAVLMHNGHTHSFASVMAHAMANPTVTINVENIGPLPGDGVPQNLFLIQPKHQDMDHLPLVLYKYQGRFHVLAGNANVIQARTNKQVAVKCKLLSTPTLKKCRIINEAPAPAQSLEQTKPARPAPIDHRKGRPTPNRY